MRKTNLSKPGKLFLDYEANKVPNGFVSWVRIMEKRINISEKCSQVLMHLEEDNLYEALDIYEEITSYNPTKTWH